MDIKTYKAAVEAILFAYGEPLTSDKIAQVLHLSEDLVLRLLEMLRKDYGRAESGLCLLQLENRWQMATKSEYADYIKTILDNRRNAPLSNAALETLTIIAYNQPVSRSFIEQVRGVDSSSSVSMLQEKGLVEEAGRLDLPGRPISFRTTDVFLRTFGLSSLVDLPSLYEEPGVQQTMDDLLAQAEQVKVQEDEPSLAVPTRAQKTQARADLEVTASALKTASDAADTLMKHLKFTEVPTPEDTETCAEVP